MTIVVTWWNGLLATELKHLDRGKKQIVFLDKNQLDITNTASCHQMFPTYQPTLVINCAAYTKVDDAEDIWYDLNKEINTTAVGILATLCQKFNCCFLTISTDYVFEGTSLTGYQEDDLPNPVNQYGAAKYAGEQLARHNNPTSIIIRTSRLYGWWTQHKHFVGTMLRLAASKPTCGVVADQRWAPTSAKDLAEKILFIATNPTPRQGKTLHCTNTTPAGWIARYTFACRIFSLIDTSIQCTPLSTSDYPTKAPRPAHSLLLNSYPELSLPNREDGLKRYLASV